MALPLNRRMRLAAGNRLRQRKVTYGAQGLQTGVPKFNQQRNIRAGDQPQKPGLPRVPLPPHPTQPPTVPMPETIPEPFGVIPPRFRNDPAGYERWKLIHPRRYQERLAAHQVSLADHVPGTPAPGGTPGGAPGLPGIGDVFSNYDAGSSAIANLERAIADSQASGMNAGLIPQWQAQLDALRSQMSGLQGQYDTAVGNIGQFGDYQQGGLLGKFNQRWAAMTPQQRMAEARKWGFDTPQAYAENERYFARQTMESKTGEWNPLDKATFGGSPLISDPAKLKKLQQYINQVGPKNVKGFFDAKDAQDVLLAYQLGLPFADKLAAEHGLLAAAASSGTKPPEQTKPDATDGSQPTVSPSSPSSAAVPPQTTDALNVAIGSAESHSGKEGRGVQGQPGTPEAKLSEVEQALAQLPLDPQFEAIRRLLTAQRDQALAQVNAARGNLTAEQAVAQARLNTNAGVDQQRLMEAMAGRGIFNSSITTDNRGLLATDYARQQQDLTTSVAQALAGLSGDENAAYQNYDQGLIEALLSSAANSAADPNAAVDRYRNRNRRRRNRRRRARRNR